jgi:hypothetical protein
VCRIVSICHQLLGHLQEHERWRNVYLCTTCHRWFLIRCDPRTGIPYCGRKCWPSKQSIRSEAPTRRVVRQHPIPGWELKRPRRGRNVR